MFKSRYGTIPNICCKRFAEVQSKLIKVSSETEWIYFGAGTEVDEPLAIQKITAYFPDSRLHMAIDRKLSMTIPSNKIRSHLHEFLGSRNFFIWDEGFKKVKEFHSIGVMRQGYI